MRKSLIFSVLGIGMATGYPVMGMFPDPLEYYSPSPFATRHVAPQHEREESTQSPQTRISSSVIRPADAFLIVHRLSRWLDKYAHNLVERSDRMLSFEESIDFLFGSPSRKAEVDAIFQEREALREKALQFFKIQQHLYEMTKKKCALHGELQSRLPIEGLEEIGPFRQIDLDHELEEMRKNAEAHNRAIEVFRVIRDAASINELLRL